MKQVSKRKTMQCKQMENVKVRVSKGHLLLFLWKLPLPRPTRTGIPGTHRNTLKVL